MRRAVFGLYPQPTVVRHALIEEQASLPNTRVATGETEPHTAAAIVESHLGKFHLAMVGDRRPVGLEVIALEARAANLLGEEAIFDRMVNMLQELPIDALADRRGGAVGIDEQYSHLGFGASTLFKRPKRSCGSVEGPGGSRSQRCPEKLASIHKRVDLHEQP